MKRLGDLIGDRRSQLFTLSNLAIAQVITIILGLAGSTLWARNVSPETYGQYQVILSLMGIVGSYCLPGLGQSLTISAAKHYDGNLIRILKLRLAVTALGSLVLVGAGFFYNASQPILATGIFLVALLFPLQYFSTAWTTWLIGRGELNRRAFLSVASLLIRLSALTLLIFSNRTTLNELLSGVIGLPALFSVGVIIYILNHRTNQVTHDKTIKYGFHASAATLLGSLAITDKLILNLHLSAADVAVYSIALIFPNQIKALYGIFNQMITPGIYRADSVSEAWRYLKRKFWPLVGIFALTGVAGFVVMPVLIPLLFSERYASAVPYGKWLWLFLSITVPATYLANILRAQRKVKFVYGFSIGQPVLAFVLYLALVRYGIKGVVLAKIIVQIITAFAYILAFLYYLKIKEQKISSR